MPLTSFKFGEFELDPARYELRREGRVLKLERIPMDLLILLAESEGNVVSRQEIVERLWGKDVFVDTEHGINTAIRKIRTALREDGDKPRFVQTVQGKGYRFVAERQNGNVKSMASVPEIKAATPSELVQPVITPVKARSKWLLALGALCLLAGALIGFNAGGIRSPIFGAGHVRIQSIAVLPLANLSGDPSQDYFADGLTDELITMLAKNTSLRVVSRTSAMQYKNAKEPMRDIARELGVDGILEGSVAKTGNRVHMTVQLIYGPSDSHIWAESYDRDLNQAVVLPAELSQTIANEIKIAVSPARPKLDINPEAHDAYLRGRYFWFQNNMERSREFFQKAIEIQPNYAAAWSGLADAYVVKAVDNEAPASQVMGKASQAAHKAVELDDSLAEAHNCLAGLYLFGDWDPKRADVEAVRALELDPSRGETHHLRAYILLALNRSEESIQEQKRSTELDPFARPWALGKVLTQHRQFDAAIAEFRLRAEAQPRDATTQFLLSDVYRFKGMMPEYAHATEMGFLLANQKTAADAARHAFETGGEKGLGEFLLKDGMRSKRTEYVSPLEVAFAIARLKKKEETLQWLDKAYRERSPWLVLIQGEPDFDFLHSDERYRALMQKIGLQPTD